MKKIVLTVAIVCCCLFLREHAIAEVVTTKGMPTTVTEVKDTVAVKSTIRADGPTADTVAVKCTVIQAVDGTTIGFAVGTMAVKCTAIQAVDGTTLGFAVEVINLDVEHDLCLIVSDDINRMFRMRMFDHRGRIISPINSSSGPIAYYDRMYEEKNYRHESISPRTSRTWFVPILKEVVSNPQDPWEEWKTVAIPQGEYKASLAVNLVSTTLDAGKTIGNDFLFIDLPAVVISVDPANLEQDLLNAYMQSFHSITPYLAESTQ